MGEPEPGEGGRATKRREYRRLADYSVIGLVFPVAMILGFLAGKVIGGWFDAAAGGGLIGGLLGVAAGFYNVYKMTIKLNREDADRTDTTGRDPRP